MNRKILRIAMLCPYLPPMYSGAGEQALRIGTEIKNKGHDVFFVTASCNPQRYCRKINGIDVYYAKIKRMNSYHGQLFFGFKALIILFRMRKDFDILFSPGMGPLIGFLYKFLKIMKKKIVLRMSVFADDPGIIMKRKIGLYLLLPYRLADLIIAPSTAREKGVTENLPELRSKVVRINNCVDTDKFVPCESILKKKELLGKLGLDQREQYVSFVGRIIARKGVDFLIDVWIEVVKQCNNVTLLLVGPYDYGSKGNSSIDPVMTKLKDKLIEHNIENKVVFTGQVDSVPDYLKVSDVFAFASQAEGLPSAPIEAMAAGVPPVVLDIPDIMSDIICSGEDGIIVPRKNVKQFASCIVDLLSDSKYAFELGEKAREKVCSNFSIGVVGCNYEKLFFDVMS